MVKIRCSPLSAHHYASALAFVSKRAIQVEVVQRSWLADLCALLLRRSAYSWLDISASLSDFSAWMVDEASVVAALSRLSAIYSHLGCGAADHSIS